MAIRDAAWESKHSKFIGKRLKQLGIEDNSKAYELPLGGKPASTKPAKTTGGRQKKVAKEPEKPRGRARVPGAPAQGESVYALLGQGGASSSNLLGAEAPNIRAVTPPHGSSPAQEFGSGRGAGGHKLVSSVSRAMGDMGVSGGDALTSMGGAQNGPRGAGQGAGTRRPPSASSDNLGAGAVMKLAERLKAEAVGDTAAQSSPHMRQDAVALGLVPGYATSLSPGAMDELVQGRRRPSHFSAGPGAGVSGAPGSVRSDRPDQVRAVAQASGYAAKDAMAFPMGGAAGGKRSDPFGSLPSDAAVGPAQALRNRKERERSEAIATEFARQKHEEETERAAREAKVRQQAVYARELAEQAAQQRKAKEQERATRLSVPSFVPEPAHVAVNAPASGGMGSGHSSSSLASNAGPYGSYTTLATGSDTSSMPVAPPPGAAGRARGQYSPHAHRTDVTSQAQYTVQPSPIGEASFGAPASLPYGSEAGSDASASIGGRGQGGAAIAALRNTIATLQAQVQRLSEENARLTAENSRVAGDNARLSADAARLSQEAQASQGKCKALEGEMSRLTGKLAQAADTIDGYIQSYGPLRG